MPAGTSGNISGTKFTPVNTCLVCDTLKFLSTQKFDFQNQWRSCQKQRNWWRPLALKSLHDDMGRMGVERTLDLVRKCFYWPKMSAHVESKIITYHRCVRLSLYLKNLYYLSISQLQGHSNSYVWISSQWSQVPTISKTLWSLPTNSLSFQWLYVATSLSTTASLRKSIVIKGLALSPRS